MNYEAITFEVDGRVAIVELNRPDKLNAINKAVKEEMADALKRFSEDDDLRVMVIAGKGGKAFSVGFDLVESTGTPRTDVKKWRERTRDDYLFCRSPWDCPKPIIAMIDGHCLAGGLEFAQMCDIRYCSDTSSFGVVETRFSAGVVALGMPWIIGNRCRELIYTGDTFDAAEAERLGLVNRVYPKDRLREEVIKNAKRMGQVALDCLVWNKRAITNTYSAMGFEPALLYGLEACTLMDVIHTPEYIEFARIRAEQGLGAALAWRDGQFKPYE
ncbi:enoyl-CoA hydratase/isomerase family protein [Bosea sp. (in: a-proteobacteria)]|uniref:enoyl-CoA hydratase/isomerase family protein n=1 Tax=Bosea sp. (in: a-proteobacteria) TaxID=1871050 RepID=UPI0026132505|nr:enoyl-CoA hydratase/isomerase family protein [Bosea sp. (in: a-proteobacteria)]MCO5089483.1 enoyl-CoA hydratase/isomerase family protein [Bosea sp. (in: a-proteobacteria)]